jgi:hypothetical protein
MSRVERTVIPDEDDDEEGEEGEEDPPTNAIPRQTIGDSGAACRTPGLLLFVLLDLEVGLR